MKPDPSVKNHTPIAIVSTIGGYKSEHEINKSCQHIKGDKDRRHQPTVLLYAESEYPKDSELGIATGACLECKTDIRNQCPSGSNAFRIRGEEGIREDLAPITRE
ncbi:hypothetical protein GF389_04610 [Candidatus Dojkabacteria bacterium]|nr:hypothetical protein [Candidatus Dojkabacteria bacterium]